MFKLGAVMRCKSWFVNLCSGIHWALGVEARAPALSAKRAVDGDLVEGALENGELLVLEA